MDKNILEMHLKEFSPITLSEMDSVKLMNRVDTKFVTSYENFLNLIPFLKTNYYLQEIDGKRIAQYHTVYYDTHNVSMYINHHNGRKVRKKVRMREYLESNLCFLEVKSKNNKGRTSKKRIKIINPQIIETDPNTADFLENTSLYKINELKPHVENNFERLTLVNTGKTERLTIDLSLSFKNMRTFNSISLSDIVIIELKQDGNQPSPLKTLLPDFHIRPCGFSKYCIGSALTDPSLKRNRFKKNFVLINKLSKYKYGSIK